MDTLLKTIETDLANNRNTSYVQILNLTKNTTDITINLLNQEIAILDSLFENRLKDYTNRKFIIITLMTLVSLTLGYLLALYYFKENEIRKIRENFLATLIHDLRGPINAEQKALEYINAKSPDTPIGSCSGFLNDIYTTNEDLLRIVNNLLEICHYESRDIKLNLEPININNVINDSIRQLQPLIKDSDSVIEFDVQDNLPLVMANNIEIKRVLVNFLVNAIKHNPKGTSILISAYSQNNLISVSVKDNGRGIAESEKRKIFQRYPSAKRKIGTGLGLYLSKKIIDAHNGKIGFTSKENEGTTFYFLLPTAQDIST